MTSDQKRKLVHALTQYDAKAEKRKGYNPYALPQYFHAMDAAAEEVRDGRTLREALMAYFTGHLLDVALKAVGEAPSTDQEQR